MLPVNYFALYEQYEIELEQRDFMAAQICCTVANSFRGKGSKASKPEQFMKWKRAKNRKNDKRSQQKQTMEEQMAIAKALTVAYGGVILDKTKMK